jgi:hypothetical protein
MTDCSISFRCDRRLRRMIEQDADEQNRTMSGFLRHVYLQWRRDNDPAPARRPSTDTVTQEIAAS